LTQWDSQILSQAEDVPKSQRLQFILMAVANILNVRLSPEFVQWTMVSAPEVFSFFQ
jgi:hypothetical protein